MVVVKDNYENHVKAHFIDGLIDQSSYDVDMTFAE